MTSEAPYLIRKRGYYYRPNSEGYTSSAIMAGRYTLSEAKSITHPNGPDGPRDGMSYHLEQEIKCEELVALRKAEAAAYARGVADARKVKSLVWDWIGETHAYGSGGGLSYEILRVSTSPNLVICNPPDPNKPWRGRNLGYRKVKFLGHEWFATKDEAMTARQDEHERRILSALEDLT